MSTGILALWRSWIAERINGEEWGQGTLEYILFVLGVILFLIASAFLMRDVLSGAVSSISSWANTVGPP